MNQVLDRLKGGQYEGVIEYLEGGVEVINILFPFGGIDSDDQDNIKSLLPAGYGMVAAKGRSQSETIIIYKLAF